MSVEGVCYTFEKKSEDVLKDGCTEPCIYKSDKDGDLFCFKPGPYEPSFTCAAEEDNKLRHAWTCQNCKATGAELGNLLTSDESVSEIGKAIIDSICPLAPDLQECTDKLPDFWGGMSRTILPPFAQENICDLTNCTNQVTEVSL